jgi:endonuclease G
MKKILLGFVLGLYVVLGFANPIDTACPQHVVWGAPHITQDQQTQYLCKLGYAVNYNYQTKVANYVVENITAQALATRSAARKDEFREDPEVPPQFRSTLKDYAGAGYDRGHMAPAADFMYSAQAMSESFFLTNMMPQSPGNNRGIWKYTEELTRFYAQKYGQVYVITGTINDATSKIIGNNVVVPAYVYKIVVDPARQKAITFLYPNIKLDPKTIEQYVVSIADLEKYTGILFFPAMPPQFTGMKKVKPALADW